MSALPDDDPRSDGPGTVDDGHLAGPTVLVLDPAGAGRHGTVPASWAALGSAVHVVWLRLPAVDSPVEAARSALTSAHDDGRAVHLVAAGAGCPFAELITVQRPVTVGSLLLVARTDDSLLDRSGTVVDRALLTHRSVPVADVLAGHGITVRVVTCADADRAEHGPPLPLGHPRVVHAVHDAVHDRDGTTEPTATRSPSRPSHPGSPRSARPSGLWARLRGLGRDLVARMRRT